jgi:iron complex transport system ATP-binding protein
LAQGYRVLLLDEPAAFLDYKHQLAIHALLRKLCRDDGVTIVSVTHDATRATFESDAVLALKDGHVEFFGAPDALYDGAVLERVYDTPFRVTRGGGDMPPLVVPVERHE